MAFRDDIDAVKFASKAILEIFDEWEMTLPEAKEFCANALIDFEAILDNRAEAAWQAHQDALAESGGPDDSHYRRTMIEAGRGHLLR